MSFAVGSLVRARGREWVVLPDSRDDLLMLRPLGGSPQETTGIYLPLEADDVAPATFDLPDASHPGDFRSSRLLRDAVRLGFRSSAGPFRSFARLNVEPRPYQLVPLLMALRLDPVRLLIADDVGIGKTIEAGLIARELLDRGEIGRLAVLCPPHLAEQWQEELRSKFHIDAVLVLPSTVHRLERNIGHDQSLFDLYPYVIVSTDYIKSDRRRNEFVRTCPEFVIVDEAHTCAFSAAQRGRHQRHRLLQELAVAEDRHLILVTATPHSGDEGAFRSLLQLLRADFADLPEDLSGPEHEQDRRRVALHLVQRRREDVRHFSQEETPFPQREEAEQTYELSQAYRHLFEQVLDYARDRVRSTEGEARQQRVRWWSLLALLRSLASSPAAAAATLRARSQTADAETVDEVDALGERYVLDQDDTDDTQPLDPAPGGQEEEGSGDRQRLLRYARQAQALFGPGKDLKLDVAARLVSQLLQEGYNPILFCRFIPTAEYLADQLRALVGTVLPADVDIAAVTGLLPPRRARGAGAGTGPAHQTCAGGHRLSERGHQPAELVRCRGAL
ncbi:MAG: DEAD/DEAH box helicase [Anaerolineae bacterium]